MGRGRKRRQARREKRRARRAAKKAVREQKRADRKTVKHERKTKRRADRRKVREQRIEARRDARISKNESKVEISENKSKKKPINFDGLLETGKELLGNSGALDQFGVGDNLGVGGDRSFDEDFTGGDFAPNGGFQKTGAPPAPLPDGRVPNVFKQFFVDAFAGLGINIDKR